MDPVNSNVKLETLKTLGPTANLIKHVKKNNILNKKADDIVTMNRYIIKKSNVKKPVTLRLKTTTNIIYNRINKAGSASILALLSGLSVSNNFHMIGHGRPMIRYFFINQQRKLADLMCDDTHGSLLYTRHIYFMDLAKFGCNIKYINMVGARKIDTGTKISDSTCLDLAIAQPNMILYLNPHSLQVQFLYLFSLGGSPRN